MAKDRIEEIKAAYKAKQAEFDEKHNKYQEIYKEAREKEAKIGSEWNSAELTIKK